MILYLRGFASRTPSVTAMLASTPLNDGHCKNTDTFVRHRSREKQLTTHSQQSLQAILVAKHNVICSQ
jgi:hypothetical protein